MARPSPDPGGVPRRPAGSALGLRVLDGDGEVALVRLLPAGAWTGGSLPRSRAHDGRVAEVLARGAHPVAVDVESLESPGLAWMAERLGSSPGRLARLWTLLECCAKLEGEPVHALFERFRPAPTSRAVGEAHPRLRWRTQRAGDLIVTVAWRVRDAAAARPARPPRRPRDRGAIRPPGA